MKVLPLTIDCEEVAKHYDVSNGQMADLYWLLCNAPMEYASPVVRGNGSLPGWIKITIYYVETRIKRGIWQFAGCPLFVLKNKSLFIA